MRFIALLLITLLFTANSAKAEEAYATTIGNWTLYYNMANKYCTARSVYGDQAVAFNINPWEEKLQLQIRDTKWKVPTGYYDVNFRIDRVQHNKRAHFFGNSLFLDFEINKSVFQLFQQGNEMWITARNDRWGYQLNNTQAMLPELVTCAVSIRRIIEGESNPFGSANSANSLGGTSNPFGNDLEPVEHNPFK